MVGADLANLVNEAALLAARRGHDVVQRADFTDALEKIVLGAERKIVLTDEDRRRIAYHEGGHAIVGMLTPGADPVRKVSIIPRGQALGVTLSAPEADRFNYAEHYLLAKIKVALAAARPRRSSTASHDRRRVRHPAGHPDRARHGRALGHEREGRVPRRRQRDGQGRCCPAPTGLRGHQGADRRRGAAHRRRGAGGRPRAAPREPRQLDALAEALLERETLDEADAYAAAGSRASRRSPA